MLSAGTGPAGGYCAQPDSGADSGAEPHPTGRSGWHRACALGCAGLAVLCLSLKGLVLAGPAPGPAHSLGAPRHVAGLSESSPDSLARALCAEEALASLFFRRDTVDLPCSEVPEEVMWGAQANSPGSAQRCQYDCKLNKFLVSPVRTECLALAAASASYRNAPGGTISMSPEFGTFMDNVDWTLVKEWKQTATPQAALWQNGQSCLISFMDAESTADFRNVFNPTPIDKWGLKGVHAGMANELEVLLAQLKPDYPEIRTKCTSGITVVGFSVGGSMAELFSVLANKNGDPLGANLKVDRVYTFGALPVGTTSYPNDKAAGGCLAGQQYATAKDAPCVDDFNAIRSDAPEGATSCAALKTKGYCTSPAIEAGVLRRFCPITCGFCKAGDTQVRVDMLTNAPGGGTSFLPIQSPTTLLFAPGTQSQIDFACGQNVGSGYSYIDDLSLHTPYAYSTYLDCNLPFAV